MKKLILLSFLLVATLLVHAQRGGGNPEARAQRQVDRLTEQLNLSADQQTQMYQLFFDRQQNRTADGKKMKDLNQEERAVIREERKAAKVAFDNQVATILTPAQFETYQNAPKGQRGQKGPKGEKGQKATRGQGKNAKGEKGQGKINKGARQKATPAERAQRQTDRLTEQLGLDANQQAAVYDLIVNRAATNQKGADWKSLSPEARTALKESKKKDKQAYNAQLAEILTPAQLETYKNSVQKGKGKKGKKGNKGNKKVKLIEE